MRLDFLNYILTYFLKVSKIYLRLSCSSSCLLTFTREVEGEGGWKAVAGVLLTEPGAVEAEGKEKL